MDKGRRKGRSHRLKKKQEARRRSVLASRKRKEVQDKEEGKKEGRIIKQKEGRKV